MHLPDGIINDPRVWIGADVVAAAALGYAIHREGKTLKPEEAPLLGVMAAFIYAGQMINISVTPMVSGHLLGSVLAAVLLGPWRASIVMAVVIAVQCFLHGDGGVTALGVNYINMGLAGTFAGWLVYRGLRSVIPGSAGVLAGAAIAAWLSVALGGALVGGQIILSTPEAGDLPSKVPYLIGLQAAIGVLEAAITVGALAVIMRARPDLLGLKRAAPQPEPEPQSSEVPAP